MASCSDNYLNKMNPCQICGETGTLKILKEFQKLYEAKLQEIDKNDDYFEKAEEKINTLRLWIIDLTNQNKKLARTVEELEQEAAQNVTELENKFRNRNVNMIQKCKYCSCNKMKIDDLAESQKNKHFDRNNEIYLDTMNRYVEGIEDVLFNYLEAVLKSCCCYQNKKLNCAITAAQGVLNSEWRKEVPFAERFKNIIGVIKELNFIRKNEMSVFYNQIEQLNNESRELNKFIEKLQQEIKNYKHENKHKITKNVSHGGIQVTDVEPECADHYKKQLENSNLEIKRLKETVNCYMVKMKNLQISVQELQEINKSLAEALVTDMREEDICCENEVSCINISDQNQTEIINKLTEDLNKRDALIKSVLNSSAKSNDIIADTKLVTEFVTVLKQKYSEIQKLKEDLDEQIKINADLKCKFEALKMDHTKLQVELCLKEQIKTQSPSAYLNQSNQTQENNDEQLNLIYLESLKKDLNEANSIITQLKSRLKDCKCAEYVQDIEKKQKEIELLKNDNAVNLLDREHFIKMTTELTNKLTETKKYLCVLQNSLTKDKYTSELEGKNYTLASTVLEMEKYIECLKLELAETTKLAHGKNESKNRELEALLKTKSREVELIRKENEHLKDELVEKQCEIENLNKFKTNEIKKGQHLIEILTEKEHIVKQLEKSLADTKTNSNLDKSIELLGNTQINKLDEINNENLLLKETLIKMEHVLSKCNVENEKYRSKYKDLKCDYENLAKSTVDKDVCICDMTNQLKNIQTDFDQERNKMQRNLDIKSRIINDLKKQLQRSSDQLQNDQETVKLLNQQLHEKDSELKRLTEQYKLESNENKIKYQNVVIKIRNELLESEQVIDELREFVKKSEFAQKKLCTEYKQLQSRLFDKDRLINELQNAAQTITKHVSCNCEIAQYSETENYREQIIQDLKSTSKYQQNKIKQLSNDIVVLKEDLLQKNLTIDKFIINHKHVVEDLERNCQCSQTKYENEISQLQIIITNYKDSLSNKEDLLTKNKNEIFSLKLLLADRENEIKNLKKSHERMTTEMYSILESNNEIHQKKLCEKEKLISILRKSLKKNLFCSKCCQENNHIKDLLSEKNILINEINSTNDELIKKLKCQHQNEIDKYQERCQANEELIKQLTQQNTIATKKLQDIQTEKCILQNQLEEKHQNYEKLVENHKKCFIRMTDKYHQEIKQLEEVNTENVKLIEDLRAIKDKSDDLYQTALDEISELKAILCQKESLITEISAAQEKSKDEFCKKYNSLIQQYNDRISRNKSVISDVKNNHQTSENELKALIEENKKLRHELKRKDSIITKFIAQAEKHWSILEKEWEMKIENIKKQKNDQKEKITHLENSLQSLLSNNNTQNNKIIQLTQEIHKLNATIEENKTNYEDELNTLINNHKHSICNYQKQLLEKEKYIQELNITFEQLKQKLNQNLINYKHFKNLYCAKDSELQQYQICNLNGVHCAIKNLQAENQNLKQQNNFHAKINENLKVKLTAANSTLAIIVKDIALLKNYIKSQDIIIRNLENTETHTDTIVELQQRIAENNQQYHQRCADLQRLQNAIVEKDLILENKQTFYEQEINNIAIYKNNQETILQEKNTEIERLNNIIIDNEKLICILQKEINDLNNKIINTNQNNEAYINELENVHCIEIAEFKAYIQKCANDCEQKSEEIQILKNQLEELKQQLIISKNQFKSSQTTIQCELECQLNICNNRLLEKDETIKQLTSAICSYKNNLIDVTNLTEELSRREERVEQLQQQLNELKEKPSEYFKFEEPDQTKLDETNKKLREANKKIFYLKSKLSKEKAATNKMKLDHEKQLKTITNQYKSTICDLKKQISDKKKIIANFQQDLKRNEERTNDLAKVLQKLNSNIEMKEATLQILTESYSSEHQETEQKVIELNNIMSNYELQDKSSIKLEDEYQFIIDAQQIRESTYEYEINDLKEQLSNKEEELNNLRKSLEMEELRSNTISDKLFEKENQLLQKENEISDMQKSIDVIRKNYESTVKGLTEELSQREFELESLRKAVEETQQRHESFIKTQKNKSVKESKSTSNKVKKLGNKLSNTESQLDNVDKSIQKMRKSYETTIQQQKVKFSQDLELAQIKINNLSKELSEKQNQLDEMEKTIEEIQNNYQSTIQSKKRQSIQELESIDGKISELVDQLSKKENQLETVQKSIEVIQSKSNRESETASNKIKNLSNQLSSTENQLRCIENSIEEIQIQSNRQLEVESNKVKNLTNQLSKTESQLRNTEKSIEEMRSIYELTINDQKNQILQQNNLIDQLQQTSDKIQSHSNSFNKLLAEIKQKDDIIAKHIKINEENIKEVNKCYQIILEQEAVIKDLETTKTELYKKLAQTISQCDRQDDTKYQREIDEKNKWITDLQLKNNQLFNKIKQMQSQLQEIQIKLNNNENQKQKILKDNEKIKNQLAKLVSNYEQTEQLNKNLSQEVTIYCQELCKLRVAKAALEKDNIALSVEIKKLNEDTDNTKNAIEQAQKWIEKQHKISNALNDQIKEKCVALERLKEDRVKLLNEIYELKTSNKKLLDENNKLMNRIQFSKFDQNTNHCASYRNISNGEQSLTTYTVSDSLPKTICYEPLTITRDTDANTNTSTATSINDSSYYNVCPAKSLLVIKPCCHGSTPVCRFNKEANRFVCNSSNSHSSCSYSNS